MVRRCYVRGCGSSFKRGGNITFHVLPLSKPAILQKWIAFLGYSEDSLYCKKSVTVCSNHFRKEDYKEYTNNKVLIPNAVPSINVPNAESSNGNNPECICRFCGECQENLLNIFEETNQGLLLKIQKYLSAISVHPNDELPTKICMQCIAALSNFATFHNKAVETQNRLRKMFCSDTKPIEMKHLDVTFDDNETRLRDNVDCHPVIKVEPHPKPCVKLKIKETKPKDMPPPAHKTFEIENGYFRCIQCDTRLISKRAFNNHIKYSCVSPIKRMKMAP